MKAIVYEEFGGPLAIASVPDPVPTPDGVVIAVRATGICRSDWHGWKGHDSDIRLPHVPGHELAGIVESTGDQVRRWKPGDRVTLPFSVGCGTCSTCNEGNPQICENYFQPGFTAWGSFAEYVAIPHADFNLVQIPDRLDFSTASILGCRFVTSFRALVDVGRVAPGEWVAIHGCGGIGLSAVMIARAHGARVVAVDIRDEALALARDLGADAVVRAEPEVDLPRLIRELTGGGAHLSLDALGSKVTLANSIRSLRKRGRHIQVGLLVGDDRDPPTPMSEVIADELEILGSHGMQASRYDALFELIDAGRIHPQDLVKKRVTLEDAPEELRAMGEYQVLGMTVIEEF